MRGKVILITGASSGIGAGTAVHFAAKGCLLALAGRSQPRLQETLKTCVQEGAKKDDILLISADLQVFENLAIIVEKTIKRFGKLDVLVNNAAYHAFCDYTNVTLEHYDMIMNTNLRATFFLTQVALPHLIASKGNVVNVSGISANIPFQAGIITALAKAALDHFTRTLALDVADKGVRVNSVNPGSVHTPLFDNLGLPQSFEKICENRHAMKRGGTVEEVVRSIAFLADNEQPSFTTGVALIVDGGAVLLGAIP